MLKKLVVLGLMMGSLLPADLFSQATTFTGDPDKYREELNIFMGPNLDEEQKAELSLFLVNWDSTAFDEITRIRIIDISSQFAGRSMRPVPHFLGLITTLNIFAAEENNNELTGNWLAGLSELLFDPRNTIDIINRYVRSTGTLIKENIISGSAAVRWKIKGSRPQFRHDTTFIVIIENATLTCYSQKDSTEIYNASGIYYPDIQEFRGTKGRVTWERAGYPKEDVFADIENYAINTKRNSYTVDSAKLTHIEYFKTPVYGILSDMSISFRNKEQASFPRFETYTKEFKLDNIYEGVNYTGGLAIEGASTKGTGTKASPAGIDLFRNDTLYLKVRSLEYIFNKTGLTGAETSMTLYLGKDSIFHTNLSLSYNANLRQVSLYRGNNPVSKSPCFNSFHNLDMYFELLSWDMNTSKIILTRARGASLGQAQFESVSFFDAEYFMKLAGLDEYHPLIRLKRFSEFYYSETFPVEEFARWMGRPVEAVTGMCIDLANKGFLFYDRRFNEVTLKDKVDDFLNSFSKKQDYDVLYITSETKTPVDNAILDLSNYNLTVNGVSGVFLSDSQRVAIYPYNNRLVIGKNRDMKFDGVVVAGLFTLFGHDFSFSYDTFKIHLSKIDSIRIAVETDKRDQYGNPLIREVDNLIQLTSADIYIDDPKNKSGLKSLDQYPIFNAPTYSYIFFDEIPGLEGIYPREDYYFKINAFNYENIDHYKIEDMYLGGEFFAGNLLKPMPQNLIIQDNNSLGFNMNIPEEGIDIYDSRGMLYDNLRMSNKGLIGSGTLSYLSSSSKSEEFRIYPDSMLTTASEFIIERDSSGLYPSLQSKDVDIKWLPGKDIWLAGSEEGKQFEMFDNGTTLDGSLIMTSQELNGSGIINTTDSRVVSDLFRFSSVSISADSSVYNLKSPSTSGYSFIAEDARTEINFDLRTTRFHLNSNLSVVKFPEIQYICTMTDFSYDMDSRILSMEQQGKSESTLLTADELLRLDFKKLDKPTFFATNTIGDTISFSSYKGSYHLNEEYIEADNISYIHIADALIQPGNGKIIINRRAKINQLNDAVIAVNNHHLLHSATINIESSKRYTGSAVYDYTDENKDIQRIPFSEITVDTLRTSARGYIPATQNFMLSPAFSFSGDVLLYPDKDKLYYNGSAGIVNNCSNLESYPVRFKSYIDPRNIMIPMDEKPRDINENMIFSGSFLNIDSIHIYPAFLSAQKSWNDANIVSSQGFLYYEKAKGRYLITSLAKLADPLLHGDLISFDRNFCILSGEGKLNLGTNFELVNFNSAGKIVHSLDSAKVELEAIMAFDFHFSPEALKIMSDEIRMMPSLKPVNLNSDLYTKGMKDLLGAETASRIKEETDLFGTSGSLPKDFNYEILLNHVNLKWNDASSSFISEGPIGIGFIGTQPLNVFVDGFVEIQRRRSGDMFDIYLKADESTFYYFSFVRGNLMTQAENNAYNTLVASIKLKDRKHPKSTNRQPYTYMIAVEDRLSRFLRRMRNEFVEENILEGITR